jgi:hypothetical protein
MSKAGIRLTLRISVFIGGEAAADELQSLVLGEAPPRGQSLEHAH